MLLNVHVKNLALIEDIDVCFDEGLNILTGETGAGKSIILGAVNIALGQKAPKEIIRNKDESGLAELVFSVENNEIKEKLEELGVDFCDDDQVIISRRIVNGRSMTKVNGQAFAASDLRNMAIYLINIHGQHDNEILLHKNRHLSILDEYGGSELEKIKICVKEKYELYREIKEKLDDFSIDEEERQREIALCNYEIEEIKNACLINGEDVELEEKYRLSSNSRKIVSVLSQIHDFIGSENALKYIGTAVKEIAQISVLHEKIQQFQSSLYDLEAICNDLERDIADYIDDLSFDEEENQRISDRLDLINRLKAKYGKTIDDIKEYEIKTSKRLEILNNFGEEKEKLNNELDIIKSDYIELAKKLRSMRKKKAESFRKDMIKTLTELNFLEVKFDTEFGETQDMTQNGMDTMEFVISTNPGESLKPLADIASGGELSRIMLGLKSILARKDNIETLIFDEIDSGISGRTAQKVSEKLGELSKNHQIICITHLPQIAAMADNHYLIEKKLKNNKTVTEIRLLDYNSSVNELGRMLGGVEITESVIANAKEMKKLAKSKR